MNQIDDLWQNFVDHEKSRLTSLPVHELLALPFFTTQFVDSTKEITQYGLWHEMPGYRGSEVHSFILMAERKLFLGVYRKYLAGFAVNKTGAVVKIADDVLYSYD